MRTPGLKIEDVVKRVRVDVTSETGDKQLPWQSSSLMGDFYFRPVEGEAENAALAEERRRLEEERRKLGQLKADLEAQKQQEDRVQTASLPQAPELTPPSQTPDASIVARDGQYVAYANGVVRDTKTGLEWKAFCSEWAELEQEARKARRGLRKNPNVMALLGSTGMAAGRRSSKRFGRAVRRGPRIRRTTADAATARGISTTAPTSRRTLRPRHAMSTASASPGGRYTVWMAMGMGRRVNPCHEESMCRVSTESDDFPCYNRNH